MYKFELEEHLELCPYNKVDGVKTAQMDGKSSRRRVSILYLELERVARTRRVTRRRIPWTANRPDAQEAVLTLRATQSVPQAACRRLSSHMNPSCGNTFDSKASLLKWHLIILVVFNGDDTATGTSK